MALIKFGGGVTQASGSIGGTTYARNRFGNYSRSRTKPVNPSSTAQNLIRSSMAYLSQYWSANLTDEERGKWATYAAAVPGLNRLGESVYYTGLNQFLRSNIVRVMTGDAVIDAGPTTLSLPEQDPSMSATFTTSTQKIGITYDEDLPWASEVGARMLIFQGQPQIATRNFFKGPWKYAGEIISTDSSPKDLDAVFPIVTDQKIWVYGRIQRADGRLSNPFRFSGLAVAGA